MHAAEAGIDVLIYERVVERCALPGHAADQADCFGGHFRKVDGDT